MLKILKIRVDGYKLLEPNFEIKLLNESRVNEDDLNNEIFRIDNNLYSFHSIGLVGANSSGKSSILNLILNSYMFLHDGRWVYNSNDFNSNEISISITFYLSKKIYKYSTILCPNNSINNTREKYCILKNEELLVLTLDPNRGKMNINSFEEKKGNIKDITKDVLFKSLEDTSSIVELTKSEVKVDAFSMNNVCDFDQSLVRNSFFEILKRSDIKLSTEIFKLLDEGIEYIRFEGDEMVVLKRINEKEVLMPRMNLLTLLSGGTFRGYELFVRAINALNNGSVFIVDEIENCFQKNLVDNLLILFNDVKTNKNKAQLIFSTHYVETLDVLSRSDNIFIVKKEDNKISAKNMSSYKNRTDKMKSRLLKNNAFDTSFNYDQLMKVRRHIIEN